MRGEKVIVRAFRGRALVRLIWQATERGVYICSPDNFRLLSRGQPGLWPVGFPKEDVFRYDAEVAAELRKHDQPDSVLWDQLKRWSDQQAQPVPM